MSCEQAPNASLKLEQEQLWRVWCTINRLPIDIPLSPNNLSNRVKDLLEAAIVGKRIAEVEVGIHLWGLEPTFRDYIKDWRRDKLHWACQIFLKADGSLVSKGDAIEFRNLLKKYCEENQLNLNDLEAEYLKKVTSLSFFPVYEWLFSRELESAKERSERERDGQQKSEIEDKDTSSDTKQGSLSSMLSDVFYGVKLLFFVIGIVVLGAGAKHCSSDYSKERERQKSSTKSKSQEQLIREKMLQKLGSH